VYCGVSEKDAGGLLWIRRRINAAHRHKAGRRLRAITGAAMAKSWRLKNAARGAICRSRPSAARATPSRHLVAALAGWRGMRYLLGARSQVLYLVYRSCQNKPLWCGKNFFGVVQRAYPRILLCTISNAAVVWLAENLGHCSSDEALISAFHYGRFLYPNSCQRSRRLGGSSPSG